MEPLRDGRLCLSSVLELSKVITGENRYDVLPRFFHLSREEAKAVAVEIAPAMVIPRRTVVTPLPWFEPVRRAETGPNEFSGFAFIG